MRLQYICEKILEVTKQRVIATTMRKVAHEKSDPFARVGDPQAEIANSSSPEDFHYNVFVAKSFG